MSGETSPTNGGQVIEPNSSTTFWPRNLVLDYGVPLSLTLADVWLPMVAVLALAVIVLVLVVRRPQAGFLGAWFFITLAPTSSIVPIVTEVGADRRMYLALAGIAWRSLAAGSGGDAVRERGVPS